MKAKTCIRLEDLAWPVTLKQTGIDNFTVEYGLQIKKHLTYGQAASELGKVIMHALACEDKLDNRMRGEESEEA